VTFKYKRQSKLLLRPIIPVRVQFDARSLRYEVLIDSGADINVFAYQLGEHLGIDVPSGEKAEILGFTGEPEELYLHPVELMIGGQIFRTRAGFMNSMDDKPYGIVGQHGFFDLFRTTFDLPNEDIELLPVD
jgi:hypothetical protein